MPGTGRNSPISKFTLTEGTHVERLNTFTFIILLAMKAREERPEARAED
jgi:hypothetical protein